MQRFIADERTGIRYELIGDYYYPCLTVAESLPLSKYGRLRQRYLRDHKRVLYFNLLTSGRLYEHLAETDTSARDMAEYLMKEMARKQGVTEELKENCCQSLAVFLFRQVFKESLSCGYSRSSQICKLFRYVYIVLQLAIQYAITNNRKDGAYYGNKKCKCNGSCAA